ncbi:VOC family protein [Paenibacillus solisilvae]|uniref:VOC family protein n=1 Tax=Paenibacillus solisilvae TaxID=2486751 RepID=A0ABW0VX05_9BACL
MLKLNRIHHVAVICSNYEVSKDFYVRVLGLTVLNEIYREERDSYKLDLAVGGEYQIELFSFPNPPARINNPEARGLRHLAFEVDDVEASVIEVQAKGVQVEPVRIDPITGKAYTFFQDPDGLPIELYEK